MEALLILENIFEIKKKDGMGRIGLLETPHGKIETPTIMPVINPQKITITPGEMQKRFNTQVIITNAYIIKRIENLREEAISNGLHELLNYNGAIATDSGAFQLMTYGKVEITNQEITEFQEKIGSDIGVFLDIPIARGSRQEYENGLKKTIERADEHIFARKKENILWLGPIQGGPHPDLVSIAAQEMGKRPFSLHALGSVVPLLENYQYYTVSEMIIAAKRHAPLERPIHLFGAGHPAFFALSVLFGIDLFDSAAYILFAREGRYLTQYGTLHLEKMAEFPCSCPICIEYSPRELQKQNIEEKSRNLALHNLYVSYEEFNTIKNAINDGRLFELALNRAITHPKLVKTLEILQKPETQELMEKLDPISKSRALCIPHEALLNQPLIYRFISRIKDRFYKWNSTLLITTIDQRIPKNPRTQVIQISPIFGVIPFELKSIYPLYQHLSIDIGVDRVKNVVKEFFDIHVHKFDQIVIDESLQYLIPNIGESKQFSKNDFGKNSEIFEKETIKAILDFQFGKNASLNVEQPRGEFSKTGILRRIFDSEKFLGAVRAHDFNIIPQPLLARKMFNSLELGKCQVVAAKDAVPFIKDKKALFAKFVVEADPEIRSGEEILIVDGERNLIGCGKAELSGSEMLAFQRGVAVSTRHVIEEDD